MNGNDAIEVNGDCSSLCQTFYKYLLSHVQYSTMHLYCQSPPMSASGSCLLPSLIMMTQKNRLKIKTTVQFIFTSLYVFVTLALQPNLQILIYYTSCLHISSGWRSRCIFDISAPLSTEPSSTQSPENGFDRSSSEGSPSPSHNEESDPLEQEQPKREESAEAQQTGERNDPVSSSSNNSSEEGPSSPESASAFPSSSTELTAEGSSTADINSDSSDTAEDTMEQE